jgi:hypothetical protein
MKQIYTAFRFGTYTSNADDILNVTLQNDMYSENLRGSRQIIEEKVLGVEAPYFFYVDDEPLEFQINFAFEEKTKTEIKNLVRILITPTTYTSLNFGEYADNTYTIKTAIYNVIFVGEPVVSFIGANIDGEIKYNGYFTLTARCDRPFGFTPIAPITVTTSGLVHNSPADAEVYPKINISVTGEAITNFSLKSFTTAYAGDVLSQIGFTSIAAGETIAISGDFFTITSGGSAANQSTIYARWDRNNFKIFPGNNNLRISYTGNATVTVTVEYDAPTFISVL